MNWDRFTEACPEIATKARERFESDELVVLGTIRRDGSPRISPNEVDFAAGKLLLGMMWRSRKALDVSRDPRVVVHSRPRDRLGTGGDVKLYGVLVSEEDATVRRDYGDAIERRIGWRPQEPNYHLFSLDVLSAGYITFGTDRQALSWDPAGGLRQLPVPD